MVGKVQKHVRTKAKKKKKSAAPYHDEENRLERIASLRSKVANKPKKGLSHTLEVEKTEKQAVPNKKEIKRIKKQLKAAQLEKGEWKKKLQVEKKAHGQTKTSLYEAKEIIKEEQLQREELEETIAQLEKDLGEVKEEQRREREQHRQMVYKMEGYQRKISAYRGQVLPLQKATSNYERQLELWQSEKKELEAKVDEVAKLLSEEKTAHHLTKKRLEDLAQIQIPNVLHLMDEQLSMKNLHQFRNLPQLYRKYQMYRATKKRFNKTMFVEKEPVWGTLHQCSAGWQFKGLSGILEDIDITGDHVLEESIPALAVNEGDEMSLLATYPVMDETLKSVYVYKDTKNESSRNESTPPTPLPVDSDLRVLVVTALNGARYKRFLLDCGVQGDWIDAYEKNKKHVGNEMNKADVVLLCPEHMPHSVLDYLDSDKPHKYHFLPQHNEDIIWHRVRYAAIELGRELDSI